MPKILVTGMAGTGKSTALRALAARGHRVVDTDTDEWSRWATAPDGSRTLPPHGVPMVSIPDHSGGAGDQSPGPL